MEQTLTLNSSGTIIRSASTIVNIRLHSGGIVYEFSPEKTIDSYELALLMQIFLCHQHSGYDAIYQYLEDNNLMRHFKKVN